MLKEVPENTRLIFYQVYFYLLTLNLHPNVGGENQQYF